MQVHKPQPSLPTICSSRGKYININTPKTKETTPTRNKEKIKIKETCGVQGY